MSDDPYSILGVSKTATADEIKKAYRKLARTSHPDINPDDAGSKERFVRISNAYDLLKDPKTRARFDAGEIDASGQEKPDRRFYRDYADAPGNSYRGGGGFQGFEGFGDLGGAGDIFEEILRRQAGGGARAGGGRQGFAMPGADRRYALDVAFLGAVRGEKTRITLPDGASLEVQIPAGVADGQTIRLRGKGDAGHGGAPAGDALITISVRPHPVFRREGDDIVLTLPITLDEAVLGGKVATPTIDGPVNLTIPAGASSGQTLRLRGRGIKAGKSDKRGDQRVELKIVAPPSIDEELKTFMEEWRKTHAHDPRKAAFKGMPS
ncbi:DnaJ-like protein [Hoeflea marina]|uniref:DnaJ-like protein n=1 Tax=Hoeflea marina TaxID=274592 RepID=A0A317PPD0_9HYPH|nr:DnaJ C-terminal domain-containing protein [Hoeflea marina]PWW01999.1 DnaJ-like protein [Hoeflea marina]